MEVYMTDENTKTFKVGVQKTPKSNTVVIAPYNPDVHGFNADNTEGDKILATMLTLASRFTGTTIDIHSKALQEASKSPSANRFSTTVVENAMKSGKYEVNVVLGRFKDANGNPKPYIRLDPKGEFKATGSTGTVYI